MNPSFRSGHRSPRRIALEPEPECRIPRRDRRPQGESEFLLDIDSLDTDRRLPSTEKILRQLLQIARRSRAELVEVRLIRMQPADLTSELIHRPPRPSCASASAVGETTCIRVVSPAPPADRRFRPAQTPSDAASPTTCRSQLPPRDEPMVPGLARTGSNPGRSLPARSDWGRDAHRSTPS